ncbi:MAG: methyl-accepting chemotaxis protein [Clostridium sp.]|nr:methyl-accepting chemotaxis protein [Clostridium sp.]MCM1547134.1 methyl-accepting chemotaxis protein [Ruminococcus sp.]
MNFDDGNFMQDVQNDFANESNFTDLQNSNSTDLSSAALSKLQDAEHLIKLSGSQMNKLNEEFESLENMAQDSVSRINSTMQTVKVIQDVATNTRILGFNAYVEATHAKENGKGFAVVTQEIRSLADTSMESADEIESAIKLISDSVKKLDAQLKNTHNTINECNKNIEEFSRILEELTQK